MGFERLDSTIFFWWDESTNNLGWKRGETNHDTDKGVKPTITRQEMGEKMVKSTLPVVPARGEAEVALKIYIRPFSSIELACAVRQPSPCVHSAKVVSCFTCHI